MLKKAMLDNGEIFLGCYSMALDMWRILLPSEWARIFRAGVGVVGLPNGRLAVTTNKKAKSARG